MISTPALDLSSPLLVPLQVFNLRPSRTLHPERARALWPADSTHESLLTLEPVQRALHARRSAQLLNSLAEHAEPVFDERHPDMPLALAAPQLLQQIARHAGAMLMGTQLRRIIVRERLLQARQELGEQVFQWACFQGAELHGGLNHEQIAPILNRAASGAPLDTQADLLGSVLIAHAWHDAPAPIRLRANWKLAPSCITHLTLNNFGLQPNTARRLCLALMQRLDSRWLSFFQTTR